ncbi:TonB-dependent receptor [Lysobacter gummosus]|uniref:TonB-dependent receptor n=1 Tax=Lysobacter gummosus TaxID=262324 RepID=A0ABY3XHM6_9GAMM|nr:TonB-dependent receptor [Lysobacter gummosus]ALN90632.1 tonB dependent receptor family protein [Lysobacter gummosus]UNP31122.1 TonB-dependent receptor [Lysobacter gummosus]
MHKQHLALAVLAALAAQPSLSRAQSAPAEPAPAPQAAADEPTAATTLDAIEVTAQHRRENAQKIPLAVSVVGAESLERINATDISALATLVPSVTFSAGNELRNNSIRIRGVGTDVFSTGVEPSVSTVVDGVVLQRPGSAFSDLGDIERVEVLRGPQGTLFGKNSSAGVVNVITRAPDFDGTTGEVSALLAQDNERRINGSVSGPLAPNLAYRFAGFYRTQDGNVRNRASGDSVNDQEAYGARGKLAWRSSDERSGVTLSADYSRLDADCCALPLIRASNNPRSPVTGTPVGRGNDQVNNDVSPFVRQKNYGASLTADIGLGDYTLTSITAWRKFANDSNVDLDDTQARLIRSNRNLESSRTTTQELRLASPTGGRFDYVVGLYYFDGSVYNSLDRRGLNLGAVALIAPDGGIVPIVPGDEAVLAGHSRVDTRNASLFGQANWHLSDRFTVTGGLRYLDEKQTLRFVRPVSGFFNGSNQPATNPAFGPVTGRYGDRATIGKLSATYEFTPKITGYLSYSTGYKSEGIAATLGLTAAQFAAGPAPAETSSQFEAGLKTQLFDDMLRLNLTGFRTRFDDYQAQTFNAATGLVVLTSAGTVAIDGVEAEFVLRPNLYFSLSGGATYLDARFQDVPNGPCYSGQTAAQGCVSAGAGRPAVQDLDGKPFMNAPKWRYTLGARLEGPLSGRLDGYLQADYRWQDRVVFDISQNPDMLQDAYGVADLSAGLIWDGGKYELGVFVKNLFDEQYAANIMAVSGAAGANAYAQQLARDFRRYGGLTFRVRF